jgi:hypothetical protein
MFAATAALPISAARADEGMWTFDAFPAAKMRADYGFAPDQAWLDRVRGAAVRLTGGCSASFVSGEGLILTNHHCIASCLQDLSSASNDLHKNGIVTRARSEEKLCPGQQAEVVTAIADVTKDVKGAIGSATGSAAVKARNAAIARIEAAGCTDPKTTRCQVVSLYGGGQYKLYTYRKYSDVRVVWAPEAKAAQFGGDPDNFNFPRYSMDASFLRAYENGKPVATPQHLKWTARAPVDGEPTFVVGNPGSTQRLLTQEQIAFAREVSAPINVAIFSELRGRLINAMAQSPARYREGKEELDGIENSLKVYIGRVKALNDPAFMGKIAAAEADLKAKSANNPAIGNPWARSPGQWPPIASFICRTASSNRRAASTIMPQRWSAPRPSAPSRMRSACPVTATALCHYLKSSCSTRGRSRRGWNSCSSNGACPSRANISGQTIRIRSCCSGANPQKHSRRG